MQNSTPKAILLSSLLICSLACANYKLHTPTTSNLKKFQATISNLQISHTMYLIGDAGDAGLDSSKAATTQLLKKHLVKASEKSSVIFLGDNNYPEGIPPKSLISEREAAESNLMAQLHALEDFKGRPIFLPGNHDWKKYKAKGLKRQEKIIEKHLNAGIEDEDLWENYFLPDNGCPGPEVIEIDEQLVVIVIDSEWWLLNWDNESNINDGCEIKSREEMAALVADEIRDHKGKNIVIAAHHALRSYGPHGGKYSLKNHLFPATIASDNFYLPLPLLGTILLGVRSSGVYRQDLNHKLYQDLEDALVKPAEAAGEYIFVGGHEHNLQYIQDDGQHFIVSGAGSKTTPVAKGAKALFGYGHQGFSKIDFYEDGSAWVEFWVPDDSAPNGTMVFKQQMKGALPKSPTDIIPTSFPEYEIQADSTLQFPITTNVKPTKNFETFMLGEHYRDLYLEQFNFPVLDLATYKGGMKVIKKGGGKQTNSLRLATKDGKEYVMRSMTKDVSRGIPYPFNKMPLVTYLFQDNYLATHPFAPLVVPTLADAANVFHANPEIFYVPKQPSLGVHNDFFGGEIYIVEERASKEWPDLASFGNGKKFISSYELAEKTTKNHHHHIDQNWVARSRIFDLLIGDWDRHDDQWRWMVTEIDKDNKLYRPIPRDRDQAFSKYDGFVVKLLSPYNLFLRQLTDYNEKINNYKWAIYNTRHFDNNFLNELPLDDWINEAKFIQQQLTDEVITKAFSHFPKKVYTMTAPEMIRVLKIRRDNLQDIAAAIYDQLATKVTVYGSEKEEYFQVIRKDDEHTEVNMYDSNKKGEMKERLYHRVFKTSETKEIFLYGLGEDDVFNISGKVKKGVVVRVVGGQGKDKFIDESKVTGWSRKNKYYDSMEGNLLEVGSEGKDMTGGHAENNNYNRLGNQYDENVFTPLPILGINGDDGFLIGFNATLKVSQFNKSPHGQQHNFGLSYATTRALDIRYRGEFVELANLWDLIINAEFRGGRYAFNFFGVGNETERPIDDVEFYQVRQSMRYLDIGWQRRFASDIGRFTIRPLIQSNEIQNSQNRFIDGDATGLSDKDFEQRIYAGIASSLNFESVDNNISPRDGFRFNTAVKWRKNLTGSTRQFTNYETDLTIYKSFGPIRNVVFASRIGTQFIRGDYDFYFAPSLGQKQNLRGFLRNRYRGRTSFFHTTDLRIGLASVNNPILPFSLGITGSFDYGRVWEQDVSSDVMHTSYGGGIWLVPLNLVVVSISYHKSADDNRFILGLGQAF